MSTASRYHLSIALLLGLAAAAPSAGAQNYRPIEIEILANRKENEISLADKNKSIDITVLGSLNFSVLDIEKGSIEVGGIPPNSMTGRSVDYNSDRNRDFEYKINIGKLNLTEESKELCLTGVLKDGQKFRGCAPITVKP